jgi:hypothetical protein
MRILATTSFERFLGCYGAVLSVDRGSGKPGEIGQNAGFADELITITGFCLYCESPFVETIFADYLGMAKGLMMTRFFAAAAISICSLLLISAPARAQSDSDCFPWQEMRDGRCVPKGTSAPARAPTVSGPCIGGTNDAGGQCVCPANTHLDDTSGSCLANVVPAVPQAPKPAVNVVCDGGQLSGGGCACPSGFKLRPAGDNVAAGGTCVRTDAENCLGGELTVAGACLCNRRVIMSGEEYALEYVNGKCIPQRCSIAALRDGKCALTAAKSGSVEPEEKARPASPKVGTQEPEQRHHCGRGMIRTHTGCVALRRRSPSFYESGPAGVSGYYRSYQFPGYSNSAPQN